MKFRRVDHLAWRQVMGETIVLDLQQRVMYGLNAAGGAVLEAAAVPRDAAALGDAAGFVAELERLGLVELLEVTTTVVDSSDLPHLTTTPEILWREALAPMTHQASLPMSIEDPGCTLGGGGVGP